MNLSLEGHELENCNAFKRVQNEENLRILVNERSIKISQEAAELKVLKEKLEKYMKKLQETVEELERMNYYLGREGRILKGLVENY